MELYTLRPLVAPSALGMQQPRAFVHVSSSLPQEKHHTQYIFGLQCEGVKVVKLHSTSYVPVIRSNHEDWKHIVCAH